MPNPLESSLNDDPSIGSPARLAGRMVGVSAIALTLIGGVTGGEPQPGGLSGQRKNPFVHSAQRVATNPIDSAKLPQFQPVAKVRLQVPQVKLASSSTRSVFVGPQWDETGPNVSDTEAATHSNFPAASMAPLPATSARPTRLPLPLPDPHSSFAGPSSFQTKLASASRKRAEFLSHQAPSNHSNPPVYLATQTARSQFKIAAGLLQQAQLEYDCSAFASAETSVWESIQRSAQAIDLVNTGAMRSSNEVSALKRLHRGQRALIEACDFVGPFAQQDPLAIARLARAHETPVLRETLPPMRTTFDRSAASNTELPTGSEAIDRYLDYARMQFSVLSAKSLLAAQTLDLLAAIRLGRNELAQLPGPTAICLRRAAVQGQSSNADLVAKLGHHLADVGLIEEARWALRHSLTLQPNQTNATRLAAMDAAARHSGGDNTSSDHLGRSVLAATRSRARTPEVITMSPEQFASISQSVMPGRSAATAKMVSHKTPADPSTDEKRSFVQAFAASFRTDKSGAIVLPAAENATQPAARRGSRSLPVVKKWW